MALTKSDEFEKFSSKKMTFPVLAFLYIDGTNYIAKIPSSSWLSRFSCSGKIIVKDLSVLSGENYQGSIKNQLYCKQFHC